MNVNRLSPITGLLALGLALAGCAAPPPAVFSPPELPGRWRGAIAAEAEEIHRDWWNGFGSAELSALVERAQAQSLDVAAAVARMRQAEALERIAGAALLPIVDAGVEAGRDSRPGGNAQTDGKRFGASLSASYEVDVWGRLSATHDAAQAARQASAFDRDAVRLTVTAGVAQAWLQAVALAERLHLAQRNLETAERILRWVEARARAGAASPLELAQQRGQVASQQRVVEGLRQQVDDARTAIAVLTGSTEEPALVTASLQALTLPALQAGMPSSLLTRRPDIAGAEARLLAADADLHAARAAMLPGVALGAGVGTGGDHLRRLLDNPVYSLAAALAAPIFDGGRLAARRDLARARREELLANYRRTIVAAFGDVQTSLNAAAGAQAQASAQAEELAQAERALALAERRYRTGAEMLFMLLDAQRTLYAARDAAVQLRAQRLQAAIALYKVLGGGWQRADAQRGDSLSTAQR
ncbi:MAG: efflux transporter outer membrane subunit [Burkholderiaceae bacterium]